MLKVDKVDSSWVTTEIQSDWPQGKLGQVLGWTTIVCLCSLPILGGLIVASLLLVKS